MNLPSGLTWRSIRKVSPGGAQRVRWELVDPWLRQAVSPGDRAALAAYLRISPKALRNRASQLKMNKAKPGRPPAVTPTTKQLEITAMLKHIGSPTQAAKRLGLSPQVVATQARAALLKESVSPFTGRVICHRCHGYGVTVANEHNGRGHHVCDLCSGEGYL